MNNNGLTLTIIEHKDKKLGIYFLIVDLILIICGLILSNFHSKPYELASFICFGATFISIPIFFRININLKNFRLTNNKIIIQNDKLILQIDNQTKDKQLIDISRIVLKYNGYDEGPFYHPLFNRNPKQGNLNYIEIEYLDTTNDSYEFYIKTKRDSIVLKNTLDFLKSKVDITIIKDKRN